MTVARLRAAITKPLLPVAFFLGGVTFDSVTLTRIDRLRDNLIILLYLSLLGGLIVLTTRADLGRGPGDRLNRTEGQAPAASVAASSWASSVQIKGRGSERGLAPCVFPQLIVKAPVASLQYIRKAACRAADELYGGWLALKTSV